MKEFIEIPFGAKDSELGGWEYNIPEGMEATIVDNKIVVKKKESENDRIRKSILTGLIDCRDAPDLGWSDFGGIPIEDCIAWLENQGEQKSTLRIDNSRAKVVFPFKAKVKSTGIVVTIHDGQLSIDGKEWTKYQSDNEDGYKVYEPEDLEYVCNVELNPTWSEEDERLCSCLIEEQEEALDNVKNSKYGHSEIISDLKEMYNERIDWLKSLKDRVQSQWKPSEEQIQALEYQVNSTCKGSWQYKASKELLEQLKKL